MLTILKRTIRLAWLNFTRDGTLALANVFVISMVVAAITSLFLFKGITNFEINRLQDKVDISVYFKYETTEDDILKAKDELAKVPEVKEVEYVSKDQALADFTSKHKNDPVLMASLAEVGANPFLAVLNVKSALASQYQGISNFLVTADFQNSIEKVDYSERKPVIDKIFSFTSGLNTAGIVFSILLAMVAILVAFNTIRIAIYNSREELKIQRLVGASNSFIRGPFVVQGVMVGFFATIACLLIFLLIAWGINSKMDTLFSGLNLLGFYVHNLGWIVLIQLLTGIGLGVISSLIADRKSVV